MHSDIYKQKGTQSHIYIYIYIYKYIYIYINIYIYIYIIYTLHDFLLTLYDFFERMRHLFEISNISILTNLQ